MISLESLRERNGRDSLNEDAWPGHPETLNGVSPEWARWCQRWRRTTTLARRTRQNYYYRLLQVGRWLEMTHPTVFNPDQWTRELAAEYVAAVERSTIGQWTHTDQLPHLQIGKPQSPRSKGSLLSVLRSFLLDCQDWNWMQLRFDPRRYLATPRSITSLIRTNPRVIDDDIWAKLLWAGLNLTAKDFYSKIRKLFYPVKMVQAMVVVWLFAGLRSDEIQRLRVGCVRRQRQEMPVQRWH